MELDQLISAPWRRVCRAAMLAGSVLLSTGAQAQDAYPSDTITLLVAWAAGGATDVVTRAIQPALAEELGTDIIIKNVSGAAGTIGTAEAANAEPDGYTVLVSPAGPLAVQPHLRDLPYSLDSFRPIGRISMAPMLMMVPPDSPYDSAEQIIAAAKDAPGEIVFGSVGAGTLPHLAILAIADATGVEVKHVPFQGSGNAMKAVLGGTVDAFNDQAQLAPKYGLKGLAVFSPERLEDYPDVPTFNELGYDIEMSNWIGVFVPAGTPDEIVETLNAALNDAIETDAVQDAMGKLLVTTATTTPEEFGEFTRNNFDLSRTLLENAGLVN